MNPQREEGEFPDVQIGFVTLERQSVLVAQAVVSKEYLQRFGCPLETLIDRVARLLLQSQSHAQLSDRYRPPSWYLYNQYCDEQ